MGTTGTWGTIKEVQDNLLKSFEYDKLPLGRSKVLASAKGAGGFWILREVEYMGDDGVYRNTHTTATFIKMSHSKGMTYYKEMDIDYGPGWNSCPTSWLDRIQPQSRYGEEWLESAKAAHSRKRKITAGQRFMFKDMEWSVVAHHGGEWWRVRDAHGCVYRLRSSTIQNAPIVEMVVA